MRRLERTTSEAGQNGRCRLPALAAAVVVVGAAALVGCGGGDSRGSSPTSATTSTAAVSDAAAPSALKIGYNAPVDSLDPNKSGSLQSIYVLRLIGATLTQYGSRGGPGLASSLDESSDHLSYTAKLRPDVKFSDGASVTAADVKASFERVRNDKAALHRGDLAALRSIETPDDQTVVFHLSRPFPSFPLFASMTFFTIFPKAALEQGKSFFEKPISAGPYKIDSFSGSNLTLSVNESYFGPKPKVKTLSFSVVQDPGTRLAQVKSGQLNFGYDLPPSLVPQMTGNTHPVVLTAPGMIELIPNFKSAPVSDVRVRQAISAAVDRDAINRVVFQGKSTPNASPWPKAFTGLYDDSIPTAADADKAKQLLQDTACESGCKIKLLFYTDIPWAQQTALVIQQNLKAVGIDVQLDGKDSASGVEDLKNGRFQMLLGPTTALVQAPDQWTTRNLDPAAGLVSFGKYQSDKMSELIAKIATVPREQQVDVGKQITQQFEADQPLISLVDYPIVSASNVPDDVLGMNVMSLRVG